MKLSIIVIVYDMPQQAMNTLYSLSSQYQQHVNEQEYEVVVVENKSDNNLNSQSVLSLGKNFRYFLRDEAGVSPVPAVNFGYEHAQGKNIGLIIDGAQMVSPRIIEYALLAFSMNLNALVMVPGYHLGEHDQKFHLDSGHTIEKESAKLEALNWEENGYRLFQYAVWTSSNQRGYFQPMQECSCIFTARENFEAIGKADERFNLHGGGSINLHIYRSLGMLPNSQLFVLPGEGSFHQFHGGITTQQLNDHDDRQQRLEQFDQQLNSIWQEKGDTSFKALSREPILLGAVTRWAQPFLAQASEFASKRFKRLTLNEKPFWEDDNQHTAFTENTLSYIQKNNTN